MKATIFSASDGLEVELVAGNAGQKVDLACTIFSIFLEYAVYYRSITQNANFGN